VLAVLLKKVQGGGLYKVSDLARQLGTTPQLVEMMLEELERRGYLKGTGIACSDHCTGCPVIDCLGSVQRSWTLKDKQLHPAIPNKPHVLKY
jgi:hypothetical protein